MIKKLDKRADKDEKGKKTPNSARHALKKRVDSTPSLSGPPKHAPLWAISGTLSSGISTSTAASEGTQVESRLEQTTPEAPPMTANPRRLAGEEAFHNLYESSSSSDSDSDH